MKKRNKTIKAAFSIAVAAMFIIAAGVSGANAQIYSNGPVLTGPTSRSGVAAPPGFVWSEITYNFGSTTESGTLLGFGCQRIGTATNNRCADDFKVPVGQTWTINAIVTYAYQTGFAGATSPVVAANVQIWNGRPGDAGATVIAGNNTSMPFTSIDAMIYRIANSGPPTNTVPGFTRRVWENTITVSPTAVLTSGTYWVDFQTDTGAVTGNFTPPVTVTGIRTFPGWNGRQFTGTAWANALDAGNPATAIDVPQEFPFKLLGSVGGAPAVPTSRSIDFNGDNKSDFAVARSASAGGQTTWWILNSAGQASATDWGLGVGFGGGDIATPRDFDGDGKADISVWRGNPGNPNFSFFYTLKSSDSTVAAVQFGRNGDDPTIVEDYDGDGKDDYAVFRSTPIPGFDPCGGSAAWYYKPSMTPATIFSYDCWGSAGDKAYPGDFDGDRKADFVVVRNSGGNADIYQKLSGGGTTGFRYGLFTDKFVSGDFDRDGRDDIGAVRANGLVWNWHILNSSTLATVEFSFGNSTTDYLVPADYDGDGKTDYAVWRSEPGGSNGYFYVVNTTSSPQFVKWGQSGASLTSPDYPVANFAVK